MTTRVISFLSSLESLRHTNQQGEKGYKVEKLGSRPRYTDIRSPEARQ